MDNLYFTDYFKVNSDLLEEYGAFNISLVADLPLFIDPFLLFNSKKSEYKELHKKVIDYLIFLKNKSLSRSHEAEEGELKACYVFKEVEQNWLGFSRVGNKGSGLFMDFAKALDENLYKIFQKFGQEKITKGSHLEKLCLIKDGVGRDHISDFTTNLIKEFLFNYTQTFAQKYIVEDLREKRRILRTRFNYKTESWEEVEFDLPKFKDDFVILTPRELLTRDDTWINKNDLTKEFDRIPNAIPNVQLRFQVNNYFLSQLKSDPKNKKEPTKKEKREAAIATIFKYPQLIDYFIKYKEDNGKQAESISKNKVAVSKKLYVDKYRELVTLLEGNSDFYKITGNTYNEALIRVNYLKDIIENKGGYRIFYANGILIKREEDLHILYSITWFATPSDVSREVNDGRGPADYKISRGALDKTIVEFKLASNSHLKQNLQNQAEAYQKASNAESQIKVIFFFSREERERVEQILKDIKLDSQENVILIDARNDNKLPGSKI